MDYEKKYAHAIGTPGFPLPTLVRETKMVKGKPVTTQTLGVIESGDNPYILMSAIPNTATVQGKLYRNLPTRSLLPYFEELLRRSQPGQKNYTAFVRGNPAAGKSRMVIKFCELRDPRGALIADMGGQNLENLLYRVVFSTEERKNIMGMVDEALADGSLSEVSMKALDNFGQHVLTEDNQFRVDWEGLRKDAEIPFDKVDGILASIFRIEGWDSKSSSIGFKIKDGAIIEADRTNRDLIVDEVNKSLPDSETPLQIVAQVLNGENDRHNVSLGGKGNYELVNGSISGKGNLALFTGNFPKDGTGTREMSDSWNRRLPPLDISEYGELDWHDVTGSMLTGLPICILHEITPPKIELVNGVPQVKLDQDGQRVLDNPEAFKETLLMLSTLGMTEQEKLRLPEWQTAMITHWETTLPAIKKLASFYYKWEQLVDPDSPLMQQGNLQDILMEVDDPRSPTTKVTPSTMIRHINDAQVIGPEKKSAERSGGFDLSRNWNAPVAVRKTAPEPVSSHFGSRLVALIMEEVDRTTIGKPHLRAQLMKDAAEAGLVGNPPPLAKALNIDPSKDKIAEAKTAQNLLCVMLRRQYPQLTLSENDDDLLPLRHVQAQLEALRGQIADTTISPFTTRLHVPQTDIDAAQNSLFREVAADSPERGESLADAQARMPAEKLMAFDTLLTSLALPVVGKTNLKSLWNTAPTNGAFAPDDATAIAENLADNDSGIATTTVLCRVGESANAHYATLHLLRNSKVDRGRTVIIGDESIPDEMYDRLKRNKIVYINRNFPEAAVYINSEVRNMVEPRYEASVKKAFLMRNEPTENASLAELFSFPEKSTPKQPNFITNLDPATISHSSKVSAGGGSSVVDRLM